MSLFRSLRVGLIGLMLFLPFAVQADTITLESDVLVVSGSGPSDMYLVDNVMGAAPLSEPFDLSDFMGYTVTGTETFSETPTSLTITFTNTTITCSTSTTQCGPIELSMEASSSSFPASAISSQEVIQGNFSSPDPKGFQDDPPSTAPNFFTINPGSFDLTNNLGPQNIASYYFGDGLEANGGIPNGATLTLSTFQFTEAIQPASSTPEPATFGLLASALAACWLIRRARRC